MSLRSYTQNRILARLAAQDREENLQRRQAQQDAANRIGGLSALDRLVGLAGQVPGIISQQQAAEEKSLLQDALAGLSAGERAAIEAGAAPPGAAAALPEQLAVESGIPEPGEGGMPTDTSPDFIEPEILQRIAREELGEPGGAAARKAAEAGLAAPAAMVSPAVVTRRGAARAGSPVANDVTMIPIGIGGRIPVPTVQPLAMPEEADMSAETPEVLAALTAKPVAKAKPAAAPVPAAESDITMDMGEPTITSGEQPAAAEPEPQPAPAGTVDPTVAAAQKEAKAAGLDKAAADPFEVAQAAYLEKIRGYKPPQYKQTAAQLADEIVADAIAARKPSPILDILSFGESQNKREISQRLARKLVAGEINKIRSADAQQDRTEFDAAAKMEAQQLQLTQRNEADKRKERIAANKGFNKDKMVEKLAGYQQTDSLVGDVEAAARRVVDAGEPLPGGAARALAAAKAMAIASTPEQSRTAAAGLNASLVSLGANGAVSLGAKATDKEGLQAAIDAIDSAQMSDAQKDFMKKQLIMIQGIGKQKEGGRMTDNDLRFYLDALVIKDAKTPEALLRSIHDLRVQNTRSQNQYLDIFSRLHGVDLGQEKLEELEFDRDLAARANALGFRVMSPATAAALARTGGGSLAGVAKQGAGAVGGLAAEAKRALTGEDEKAPGGVAPTPTDDVANKYGL